MRSEIHAAVPLWINTPLEPPLPSGSPVTERWRLVQKHLPPLAELLDVEIVIMNAEGYCVGGTGPYLRGVGFRMPADNALTYSLRSGQSSMVLTPGKEEVCRTCSGKGACADVANFTGPVVIENEIVAVVQIVAFTDNQRAELLMKSEKAFELISQIIGFAWARGRDVESLPEQPRDDRFPRIIGESKAILRLKAAILKAAGTNATVLIQGESGTGKELIAQAVHDNSPRHTGPFVAINCSSIPDNLFESELFGYEEGSFTGAKKGGKIGKIEMAQGGTLFLDEIGEMPLFAQPKLLRILQEYELERIGSSKKIHLDIRIIAATNRDLADMVDEGKFRSDLYYRINVINLELPPLRARKDDIVPLAANYLKKLKTKMNTPLMSISQEANAVLLDYDWPGNIRQLQNVIEYAANLCESDTLMPSDLPESIREREAAPGRPTAKPAPSASRDEDILALLEKYGYTLEGKKKIAEELGVSLRTLYRRISHLRGDDGRE